MSRPTEKTQIFLEFADGPATLDGRIQSPPPSVWFRLSPARPTKVFSTYWHFAHERQRMFFRRVSGRAHPWTQDPILSAHRFTNAYRASDRVSQYLIRNVIYSDAFDHKDTVFRILLFKIFNKIDTWQLLERAVDRISWQTFDRESYDKVLTKAKAEGKSIYSGAYIMPSGPRSGGKGLKHRFHLTLLEHMMRDDLPDKIADCASMKAAFELLRSYPSVGDFLAYQWVTDVNYSEVTQFSETEFVVPGPGARSGIRKCFEDTGGLNEAELIRFVADLQRDAFTELDLPFQTLWGRDLQLIDCQNLFCEVDKYARVRYPDVLGLGDRRRIKQKYTTGLRPPGPWYPPKWRINDSVALWMAKMEHNESHDDSAVPRKHG